MDCQGKFFRESATIESVHSKTETFLFVYVTSPQTFSFPDLGEFSSVDAGHIMQFKNLKFFWSIMQFKNLKFFFGLVTIYFDPINVEQVLIIHGFCSGVILKKSIYTCCA